ncbi:MAG: hypothetical protein HY561_12145 [Gemmatimonadetes bacterium]|nr:hypothetical protein [Gemmatimonadota bacterium]MBI4543168.1 hypothetical protein [Gemmatimonadota bacterium]
MDRVALKMYDKFGSVLRIETVTNDVPSFKHHRTVEHRDGTRTAGLAPVKKTLYSLDDDAAGRQHLEKLSRPVRDENRSYLKARSQYC